MSTADAAPPALSAPAPAAPAPSASAPLPARYTDANSDHVVLFPTGETHPRGTLFFTDSEILVLNLGYAVTDRLEVEVTYAPTATFDWALKLNLYRDDFLRFATVGALDTLLGIGAMPPIYRLGGVGTACFSRECRTSFSLNAIGLATRSDLLERNYGAVFSAGAIIGVTRVVKLLLEPTTFWELGQTRFRSSDLVWSGGVRFSGELWGLDVGVIPGGQEVGPYLPWLAFTLRTRGRQPLE